MCVRADLSKPGSVLRAECPRPRYSIVPDVADRDYGYGRTVTYITVHEPARSAARSLSLVFEVRDRRRQHHRHLILLCQTHQQTSSTWSWQHADHDQRFLNAYKTWTDRRQRLFLRPTRRLRPSVNRGLRLQCRCFLTYDRRSLVPDSVESAKGAARSTKCGQYLHRPCTVPLSPYCTIRIFSAVSTPSTR